MHFLVKHRFPLTKKLFLVVNLNVYYFYFKTSRYSIEVLLSNNRLSMSNPPKHKFLRSLNLYIYLILFRGLLWLLFLDFKDRCWSKVTIETMILWLLLNVYLFPPTCQQDFFLFLLIWSEAQEHFKTTITTFCSFDVLKIN